MDNEILKDIAFCEAINDRAKRDPLMERAVSNKKPLADYVINVLVFESMTAEQFFTDAPYRAHAAQIREMRENYEGLSGADEINVEEKNDLAETVAELQKTIKRLTEGAEDKSAEKDEAAPVDDVAAKAEGDSSEDEDGESEDEPNTEE